MASHVLEKQPITFVSEDNAYIFNCPHCLGSVVVQRHEVNCQIFRHAVFKDTGLQVNPHASKAELEHLISQDNIYGCGLPFRLSKETSEIVDWTHAEACDYI